MEFKPMVLQVKDKLGNWIPIPALKGDKGDKGETGTPGKDALDLTTPQTLTPEQQKQARENIGAAETEGKWEYVETITFEQSAYLSRDKEPDGTPYKFKRIKLLIETPADATNPPVYFGIFCGSKVVFQPLVSNFNDGKNNTSIEVFNHNNLWDGFYTSPGKNITQPYALFPSYRHMFKYPVKDYPFITKIATINVPSAGAEAFLAGTKIRVYAIRG